MNRKRSAPKSKGPPKGMFPSQRIPEQPKQLPKARWILHHDDPPCYGKLVNWYCPECDIHPDTQSTALHAYCPTCICELKNMKCPKCKKTFEPWKQ
ncbi:MAG: hypothetical protein AAB920_03365 [Patescibacteria group bacterium]